ncbi:hypothetical protein TVAG_230250 [Trichomonas vaginalis G3]|uniref:Katanin p80 subunit C-terminal domain-containing protein n=1 Tax=Trichomonas vaginalis (strain ATCC PRA-98 / G3) TaxID=412133 RepID=A2F113_TRIV3|nr:microtubule severing [Trichomonas vaginalis G3]EAY01421.1 hypothetical protein TVAG_230250 [Trichomonas vaginalis G3]KAI5529509.1 microtubule severing [Trichomonas vaginalis G3]|eukprot:XP_001330256.1 hypothetical protein [Trichomonas vaginalis G3]
MPPKLHQLQSLLAHDGNVKCVSIGEKTGQIYVSGGEDCNVNLWQIGNSNPKVCFGPFQSQITALKLDKEEERLLIGIAQGSILLYDLNDNRCLATWSQNRGEITSLAFSPVNPEIILATDRTGKFNVLSTNSRKPLQIYNHHTGSINTVAISPNGVFAATGGDDHLINVYDLSKGKKVVTLDGNMDAVYSICFHPTLNMIVSAGADRSLHFFDIDSFEELMNDMNPDSAPVDAVRFHSSGSVIITCSSDYLKFVSLQPLKIQDLFTIALETIRDISVSMAGITIASSVGSKLNIHRTKLEFFKPFKNSPVSLTPEIDNISHQVSQTPPRVEIPNQLPIPTRNRVGSESNAQTPHKRSQRQRMSFGENPVFKEFRARRQIFMTKMNDRYSRMTRINEFIGKKGLSRMLEYSAKTGDMGAEILTILRMKPEVIRFYHGVLMMQIVEKIMTAEKDLAIATTETMLQTFGRQVLDELQNKNGERYSHAKKFADSFKCIAPFLKSISISQSGSAQTAADILDEWQILLKF